MGSFPSPDFKYDRAANAERAKEYNQHMAESQLEQMIKPEPVAPQVSTYKVHDDEKFGKWGKQ